MTAPINLNKVRKVRDLAAEKAQADANALRFGRTKAQRVLEAAQKQRRESALDQMKFEDD